MRKKSKTAYKTISEVAIEIGLINKKNNRPNTHTLRFWEKNFKQIKPKLFSGKRRLYNESDIKILKKIKFLLKDKGMTLRGVKIQLDTDKSNLDEIKKDHINTKNDFKLKIKKISKLIKDLKD